MRESGPLHGVKKSKSKRISRLFEMSISDRLERARDTVNKSKRCIEESRKLVDQSQAAIDEARKRRK